MGKTLTTFMEHEQLPKSSLITWLKERLDLALEYIDVFDVVSDSLEIRTHDCGGKTVLSKSPAMCGRYGEIIRAVRADPEFEGIIYFMYKLNGELPLVQYVGKAARKGHRRPISSNMNANPHYQFARWGCKNEWHLGGLSDWLLRGHGSNNERPWSEKLLVSAMPPILRSRILFWACGWPYRGDDTCPHGIKVSLSELEKACLIANLKGVFGEDLLNKR